MNARFNPETRADLIAEVRSGSTFTAACESIGLSTATARTWMARGRKEHDTEYAIFAHAIDEAREAAATADMTDAEFLSHLSAAVRRGSVSAMRTWWAIRKDLKDEEPRPDPFGELDELYAADPVDHLVARRQARINGHD
jgi:transposase-like protein